MFLLQVQHHVCRTRVYNCTVFGYPCLSCRWFPNLGQDAVVIAQVCQRWRHAVVICCVWQQRHHTLTPGVQSKWVHQNQHLWVHGISDSIGGSKSEGMYHAQVSIDGSKTDAKWYHSERSEGIMGDNGFCRYICRPLWQINLGWRWLQSICWPRSQEHSPTCSASATTQEPCSNGKIDNKQQCLRGPLFRSNGSSLLIEAWLQ